MSAINKLRPSQTLGLSLLCLPVFLAVSYAAETATNDKPKTFIYGVIREDCYEPFLAFNLEADCLKASLSKFLGFGVILGSSIVKLPQIFKLVAAQSAAGLSHITLYAEQLTLLLGLAYSVHLELPFSTYGESLFIVIQSAILIILTWRYSKAYSTAAQLMMLASYVVLISVLFVYDHILTEAHWNLIATIPIPLAIFSRVPQIITNVLNGHTGQLSFITAFLNILGNYARIFTTMQEVSDKIVLFQHILAATLNTVIVLQILFYWNSPIAPESKKTKKE